MQMCSFFDADRCHVTWLAWGLVLAMTGCINDDLRRCGDGYCPAGLACSERMDRCYIPDICGNGEREPRETCDDGNTVSGDGCRADCQSNEACGNGVIDPNEDEAKNEECDCGTGQGPTRDPSCLGRPNDDLGGLCRTDCKLHCGDGEIRGEEPCDGEVLGTSCVGLGFDRGRLTCSDACVPVTDACGHIGWRREDIGSENIYALWGTAPGDVYAVGERAPYDLHLVHHYDGLAWSNVDLNFPGASDIAALYDVWGTGADSVHAVGDYGMVIRYQASSGWTRIDIGTAATLRGVWGSADNDIYVVGFVGAGGSTLMHYDGVEWKSRGAEISEPIDFEGIWGIGPADVYAVGVAVDDEHPGRVLHFDGSAWEVVVRNQPYLADIHGTADGRLVAVGEDGFILERRADGVWIDTARGMSRGLTDVWASENGRMFAVGRSGDILFSDGAAWTPMQSDVTVRLESVWGIGDQVIAAGRNGTLLHYQQQAWLPVGAASDNDVRAAWASDLHTIYTVGDSMHRFQDGTWTEVATGLGTRLDSIWGRDSGEILVGGRRSIIGYHYGGTWTRVFGGGAGDDGRINAFWESDTGEVFAVGAAVRVGQPVHAQIVRCQGAGCGESAGWSRIFLEEQGFLHDVWGRSARDVFAVGARGTILHFDGEQWSSMVSGIADDLHGVWGVPDGPVYAVGDQGTILRYQDGAWSRVSLPYDAERFPWVRSAQFGAIWGSGPDDIYVVGNSEGLILHWDGTGWAPVRTEIDQPLLHVWGRRDRRGSNEDVAVFFAGEAGTVLRLLETR
jgi:cysteine-rich repeat protein